MLAQPLKKHLVRVKGVHGQDLAEGWRSGPWPAVQRETWGMSRIGALHSSDPRIPVGMK